VRVRGYPRTPWRHIVAHRRWIWVEDTTTGHRYDVDYRRVDRLVQKDAVRIVESYPVNEGVNAHPRPAKHATGLDGSPRHTRQAGEPATPAAAPAASTPPPNPAPARRATSRTATAAPTATTSSEGAQ
jgi:hypothetical protein